ncbi:MFS transporter [Haloarcula litorea]|uniref:MFS transporter n=2 Tax=Haloarcula litorea TaxID=3032579 RepID=UPI0023E84D0F|nr:MFS transporter [Halomicroarcula sp. GDY20]
MASLSSIAGSDTDIVRERSFQLLFLTNMLPPLGTALMSPVLDSLVDPLGATPATVGLMMSAFTAPAVFIIPVTGFLADRYGRRPVILFGLLWFGATGTAIAFVGEFRVALALRFCQGIGFAALTPIIITSLGDLYSGTKEATAQGLRFTGSGVAQTVFPLAAGVLVGVGWQYPFLLYAIAFPIALVVYRWFEEPVHATDEAESEVAVLEQLTDLWAVVSHRRAWTIVVARGSGTLVWLGFLTYNSIVVVDVLGRTPAAAGLLAAVASTSYALAATQAGRLTARFERRLYPLVTTNVAMAVGLTTVFLAGSLAVATVGVVVMGVGFGITLSLYRSIVTDVAPPAYRGGLVSIGEGSGRAAATVTPIAMGGAIAVAAPRLGFVPAVRAVGATTAVVGVAVGVVCLFLMSAAPPIRVDGA